MSKLRPLFKIHGGKYYSCDWIISEFPKDYRDRRYFEVFGGAGSVIFNKTYSREDNFSEIDPNIYNCFYHLKNNRDTFVQIIKDVEYCEDTFEWAKNIPQSCDILSAVAEVVMRRFSRGGMRKHFAWSNRLRGGRAGDVNSWETFKEVFPLLAEKVQKINILNEDAIELIEKNNHEDVLFYVDPPYLPSTRTAKKVYSYEFTEDKHIALAEVLNNSKAKIVLSGYPSELYKKLYSDWRVISRDIANHSSQSKTKQRRIESIWLNY